MATFREIVTKLGIRADKAKLDGFNRSVDRSKQNMKAASLQAEKFRKRMNGLVRAGQAFVAVAAGSRVVRFLTTDFAEGADKAAKFSKATGIAMESYQGLAHAVQLSGGDVGDMDKALTQLGKRALEVKQGNKTLRKSFRQLGVSVTDNQGNLKKQDVLLLEMADRFRAMKDGSMKTGLAMQLFGRTGAKLIPLFNEGSKGIRNMMLEAKELGVVLTKDQAAIAENFNDEMLRAKSVLLGVRNQIAVRLLPSITSAMNAFQSWARESGNVERALVILKTAGKAVAAVLAMIAATKVANALVQVGLAAKSGIAALRGFAAAGAAAQMSIAPLAVAVAAVGLVLFDLWNFTQGKDSIIGKLLGEGKEADEVKAAANDFFGSIQEMVAELKPTLIELAKTFAKIFVQVWKAVKPLVPIILKVLVIGIKILSKLLVGFIKVFIAVFRPLFNALEALTDWFEDTGAIRIFAAFISGLFDDIKDAVNWIAEMIGPAFALAGKAAMFAWNKFISAMGWLKNAVAWVIDKAAAVEGVVEKVAKATAGRFERFGVQAFVTEKTVETARDIAVGSVNVNVTAAPNLSPAELEKRVREGATKALKDTLAAAYRNRAPVAP